MSAALGQLVGRYRSRGLLIDTNILLLFFIGSYDPSWIAKFKRTRHFDNRDFQLVLNFLAAFERWVTTPHVLTEVSNWGGQLPYANSYSFHVVLHTLVERFFEVHAPAIEVTRLPGFPRLGLADMSIEHAARGRYLVLTDDAPFAGHLIGAGVDAISFAQLRNP